MKAPEHQTRNRVMDTKIKRWDGLRILGQRDFYGIAQSAGAARRWVVRLLTAHASDETLETIELLVGEVVANAVVHSDSGKPDGLVTVFVGLGGGLIHIEVIDDGSGENTPVMRTADDDSLSGRGLSWVDLLACAWGSEQDDRSGGVVWFRLPDDGQAIYRVHPRAGRDST